MLTDDQVADVMRMMKKPKNFGSYPPGSVKWGLHTASRMVAREICEMLDKADKFTAPQDIAEEIRKRLSQPRSAT